MKIQLGRVVRRVCGRCDFAIEGDTDARECPRCQAGLIEIRASADDVIGQVIDGRYEIRAKLGEGGMGTVYRAWQASVKREVAIKLMSGPYSSDPMAVTRFEREAQLASRLSQPNTVSVLDFGKTSDGRLFIALELIRGKNLLEILRAGGALPIERVIRIGTQICDALEAAHGLGIVHRDLKLDNIIVLDDPPGRDLVKVLDFGLAKLAGDTGGTAAGLVVGTPRYIAPEAALDGKTSPAADMYAVGVIIAELALGRPLWDGDNLAELLQLKLQPRAVIAPVPSRLRTLVAALIDPAPDHRPTASAARAQLARSDDESAPAVEPPADPADRATLSMKRSRPDAPPASEPSEAATRPPAGRSPVAGSSAPVSSAVPGAAPPPPAAARRSRARPRTWIALALGAGVAVGAIGFAMQRGGAPAPAASGSAVPPTVVAGGGTTLDGGTPAVATASVPIASVPVGRTTSAGSATVTAAGTPAGADGTVMIHVRSRPDGATVKFGNQSVGTTPLDLQVPRGKTDVWVDGWLDRKLLSQAVLPDREREVMLDYESARAWNADRSPPPPDAVVLRVRTRPASTAVKIGRNNYGLSPLEIRVARSTTEITVLATWEYEIASRNVVPDHDQDVEIDLAPECANDLVRPKSRGCIARYCEDHRDAATCSAR